MGKTPAKQVEELENCFVGARRAESSVIILDQLEGILGFDANYFHCNNELRLELIELLKPQ